MLPKRIRYREERKVCRECWVMPLLKFIVPIRLINGIDDPISGKHLVDRFAEFVANADIVLLKNCGHYLHVETPKEVLRAFLNFMINKSQHTNTGYWYFTGNYPTPGGNKEVNKAFLNFIEGRNVRGY